MLHVAEIERSIRFHELLVFVTVDTGQGKPWDGRGSTARVESLMFVRAREPADPSAQAVLLYMYTPDLAALREHLLRNGLKVSPIRWPAYMPSGEIRIDDPDGYAILIAHWGKSEQEEG